MSLSTYKSTFYIIVLTILFPILFPLTILTFLPIYLTRLIVSILKSIWRPDLDKMLSLQSSFLAVDDPTDSPKWNLCVWAVYDGNIDTENIRRAFNDTVVERKLSNGRLADPQLQQFIYQWLGFLFWKWERFDMKNHSRNYDTNNNGVTTEKELQSIIKKLTWAPFQKNLSPWEFLWIRNYRACIDEYGDSTPKTIKIFRAHHGLCDGTMILQMLMGQLCGVSLSTTAKPNFRGRSLSQKIWRGLKSPLVAPYQFVKMMVEANDVNEWHLSQASELTRPFNNAITVRIPVSYIKSIKNKHGVSYGAVVMAAIAGGIRRMMIKQGKVVPDIINAGLPIPMPNHPGTLTNYWTSAFVHLPVGMRTPGLRLKRIEENLNKLKDSYAPALNHTVMSLCGGLCVGIIKKLNTNFLSTTTISNFPGPTFHRVCFMGGKRHELLDLNFAAGNGDTKSGLSFNMISCGEGVRIVTEADKSVLPNDAAVEELNVAILDELNILAQVTPCSL